MVFNIIDPVEAYEPSENTDEKARYNAAMAAHSPTLQSIYTQFFALCLEAYCRNIALLIVIVVTANAKNKIVLSAILSGLNEIHTEVENGLYIKRKKTAKRKV